MARKQQARSVRVGILDVARHAGVSAATVSRVLNGSPSVQAAHKEQVLRAVEELGYRPNLLARNLRRQQAATIGVLVSDIENPHFTQMVRVVEDAAYKLGYRVLLCNTDESADKQQAYLDVLAAERVSGVVLAPSNPAGAEIARVLDLGIPIIAFDRPVGDPRADLVAVDNVAAGRRATEYLLQAGHRRIAFVGDNRVDTCVDRRAGYEEVVRRAGLTVRLADGGSRIDGGLAATHELLSGPPLTALIVANNLMAIGALRALRERGLHIPDGVAVVGIDDPFWAEILEPPLTVLAQPVRQMAVCIIDLLRERIEANRTVPRRVIFDCHIVERGSVGPPARPQSAGLT